MPPHNIGTTLKSPEALFGGSGRICNIADGVSPAFLIAWGPTVPSGGTTGYATGCIFLNTTNGEPYKNDGDESSSTFNAQAASTAESELTLVSEAVVSQTALLVAAESELLLVSVAVVGIDAGTIATYSAAQALNSANIVLAESELDVVSEALDVDVSALSAAESHIVRVDSHLTVKDATDASLAVVLNAVSEAAFSASSLTSAVIVKAASLTTVLNTVSEALNLDESAISAAESHIVRIDSHFTARDTLDDSTSSLVSAMIVRTASASSLLSAELLNNITSKTSTAALKTTQFIEMTWDGVAYKVALVTTS